MESGAGTCTWYIVQDLGRGSHLGNRLFKISAYPRSQNDKNSADSSGVFNELNRRPKPTSAGLIPPFSDGRSSSSPSQIDISQIDERIPVCLCPRPANNDVKISFVRANVSLDK